MNPTTKSELDPFRVIIGVLATRQDSDLLVGVANAAGLRVDLVLSERDAGSHKTRIRAILPRILAAYDALGDEARLAAANVALRNFGPAYPDTRTRAVEALALAGWEVHGDALVVGSAPLREMFFPSGSQWDGHVVLRGVLGEAKRTLTIVDAYTDGTVFHMLAARSPVGLTVRLLCGRSGPAVAAEGQRFMQQHTGVTLEVRQSRDFHDRFVVIDDQSCVHVGASIKDAGNTAFMVSRVEDPDNLAALLAALAASWAAGTKLL